MMLKNQTAIISGGLGDIGRAIARTLAAHGANVALGDLLPPEKAGSFLLELERTPEAAVKARYDQVDVCDPAAVNSWVENVSSSLGAPTLIVPNAAKVTLKPILEVSPTEWDSELRVNLNGAFHLAQSAARKLVADKKPGRIVFIGSWAAHAPHTHLPAYSVTKAGLRMLMKCMALDLAAYNILVNEVAPGYVDAGLSGRFFEADSAVRDAARERVPIKQLITAGDVAAEVLHLCDPACRHQTGNVVLMDGGLSLVSTANSR